MHILERNKCLQPGFGHNALFSKTTFLTHCDVMCVFQACSQAEHDGIDELIDLGGKPRCAGKMDKNVVQSKPWVIFECTLFCFSIAIEKKSTIDTVQL